MADRQATISRQAWAEIGALFEKIEAAVAEAAVAAQASDDPDAGAAAVAETVSTALSLYVIRAVHVLETAYPGADAHERLVRMVEAHKRNRTEAHRG